MDSGRPGQERSARRLMMVLAAIIASFAAVTALRFAVEDPKEAVGFLYAVPISLAAAEFAWRGAFLAGGVTLALVVAWVVIDHVPFGTMATRIATFAAVALVIGLQVRKSQRLERERERLVEELRRLAMLDQLTGVANRRSWDERFATELRHAARGRHDLVLVAVDLDGLKQVNDSQGHDGGDRMIRAAAATLSDGIRETDFVARVGGDEFMLLLPRCTTGDAERLVARMIGAAAPGQGFSAGVAAWDGRETGGELIARADRALYGVKEAGRAGVGVAGAATA